MAPTEDWRQWATTSTKAHIDSDEYQMGAAGNAISRAQGDALKPPPVLWFHPVFGSFLAVPGLPTAAVAVLRGGCDSDTDCSR